VFRYCRNAIRRNAVSGKCCSAKHAGWPRSRGRRVEDLAFKNWSVIARIRSNLPRRKQRAKVTVPESFRGDRAGRDITGVFAVLLPIEEEECFVTTVVEFWDPYRTSQIQPVVVLLIDGSGLSARVIKPAVCVESFVLQNFVRGPVERVGSA